MDLQDVEKIQNAIDLIESVRDKVDCHYCQSHMDLALDLLRDIKDITKFNTLYQDDKAALDKLRDVIQSENMLRVLAMGSRLVGWYRRIRLAVVKSPRRRT